MRALLSGALRKPSTSTGTRRRRRKGRCTASRTASGRCRGRLQALSTLDILCLDKGDAPVRFPVRVDPVQGSCEVVKFKAVAKTPAELQDLCTAIHGNFKGCLHFEHNPVLKTCPTGRSDTLHSESYWSAVRGGQIISTGVHKDILEKQHSDGQWLFRERRVFHVWTLAGGSEKGDEGAGAWDGVVSVCVGGGGAVPVPLWLWGFSLASAWIPASC